MGVRGAGLDVVLAVTLGAAVENREMRSVPRNSVGGEAHDEEDLGRFPSLPPLEGFPAGGVPGMGVGVGVGVEVGLSSTGLDEGLLPAGVEEGLSSDTEVGVVSMRVRLVLPVLPPNILS